MPRSMSHAVSALAPSGIRRINQLAAAHPDCIALALGEPEFDTPQHISDAAVEALRLGQTHYPPNSGTTELREALAADAIAAQTPYTPDEIVVTTGATEAIAATFAALLNPGDEVIIPTPAFGLYECTARMFHAEPVALPTQDDGFQITEDRLRAAITPATKLIVLCSPNNPTGCILDAASLDVVARVAEQTGVYVVCDDVYRRLVYTATFERFAVRHAELRNQIVVVESFSKPWAMTGWRLGWIAAAAPLAQQIAKAHAYLVSSAVSFTMPAAARALQVDCSKMRLCYQERKDRVVKALRGIGLHVEEPQGAFYAFPYIGELGLSSEEFCEQAIQRAGVALVPGTCFGTEGYVRLSYCVSDADLNRGLARLADFVRRKASYL